MNLHPEERVGLRAKVRTIVESAFENPELSWLFISVNPCLRNTDGHFLYLDQRLQEAVAARGGAFVSFAHETFQSGPAWLAPILSQPPKSFGTPFASECRVNFVQELQSALDEALKAAKSKTVLAFLYTGHTVQLPLVHEVMAGIEHPNLSFVFDLYGGYFDFDASSIKHAKCVTLAETTLKFCAGLPSDPRIHLVADEVFARNLITKYQDDTAPILPFYTLLKSGQRESVHPCELDHSSDSITLAYLNNTAPERGFPLLLDAVRTCRKLRPSTQWRFVFAAGNRSDDEPDVVIGEIVRALIAEGVEIVNGPLREPKLSSLFRQADAILCPYRARAFYSRTSTLVSDSISYGKPVIAARQTWAGRLIEKYRFGTTFKDGDGVDLGRASVELADRLSDVRQNLINHAPQWLRENSVDALVQSLRTMQAPTQANCTHKQEREWKQFVCRAFSSYLSGLVAAFCNGLDLRSALGSSPFSEPILENDSMLDTTMMESALSELLTKTIRARDLSRPLLERIAHLEALLAKQKTKTTEQKNENRLLKERQLAELARIKSSFSYKPWKKLFFLK